MVATMRIILFRYKLKSDNILLKNYDGYKYYNSGIFASNQVY